MYGTHKSITIGDKLVHLTWSEQEGNLPGALSIDVESRPVDDFSEIDTRVAGLIVLRKEMALRGIRLHDGSRSGEAHRNLSTWGPRFWADANSDMSGKHVPFYVNVRRKGPGWQVADWDYSNDILDNTLGPSHERGELLRVFVDLKKHPEQDGYTVPVYYVMPNRAYQSRLAWHRDNTTDRPQNPESRHCVITAQEVSQWEDRWDLFEPDPEDDRASLNPRLSKARD